MTIVNCEKKKGHQGDHKGSDPNGLEAWRWKNRG